MSDLMALIDAPYYGCGGEHMKAVKSPDGVLPDIIIDEERRPRMTLFVMTYRKKPMPETGIIEATSLEKAEELGRAWCDHNRARFINVHDYILIREDE